MRNTNNKTLMIIVLATVFGLLAGVVGAVIARIYVLEKTLNIPLVGEINLSDDNYGNKNIIIRGAKKVVVEQNTKIAETKLAVEKSIVGIFKKKVLTPPLTKGAIATGTNNIFNIENYYNVNNRIDEGFIITSDGWIITAFTPDKLKEIEKIPEKIKQDVLDQYAVILKDKKVYPVNNIVYDPITNYSFWNIKANDLPVRGFSDSDEITIGQLAISANWDGMLWLTTITGRKNGNKLAVSSSEALNHELLLADYPDEEFKFKFIFDLGGNLLALTGSDNSIKPIYRFTTSINHLLENKEIKPVFLGVNYIDLFELVNSENKNGTKGALIYKDKSGIAVKKGSPAALAGLREGDIILSVDNTSLDNYKSLNYIIAQHFVGDELEIEFLRGGEREAVKVRLGELKMQ